jgi:DNA-binding MarR family transcriptional regulator
LQSPAERRLELMARGSIKRRAPCRDGGNAARNKAPVRNGAPVRESTGDAIDYGPLQEWIGFNLRMAQDASFQAFSRRSKEIGVKPGRFATLTLIGRNPGISQTALSRANGRDKSTLTPLLVDLVRRGLVRRTQAHNDRRSYQLTLTRAGERLLHQLTTCAREHERKLDAVIGRRGRAQFLHALRKLAAEV